MDCVSEARSAVSRISPRAAPSLLNLGCGARFHPAWLNLDISPVHSSIRMWDVTRRLPFPDDSFDAVYHSHLLEHLHCDRALPFLNDCRRVLKPGGVLRIAIPNLEAIARLYLHALEEAWYGDRKALDEHRWMVMELYDQTTREWTGGAMLQYLQDDATSLAWYRVGADGKTIKESRTMHALPARLPWRDRVRGWLFGSWRERLVRWLLGTEYELLQLGRFRRSGEVHHWMYDRVALRELLRQAGFDAFRCVGPSDSDIPGWKDYHLDVAPDGSIHKPDSLFIEASA